MFCQLTGVGVMFCQLTGVGVMFCQVFEGDGSYPLFVWIKKFNNDKGFFIFFFFVIVEGWGEGYPPIWTFL